MTAPGATRTRSAHGRDVAAAERRGAGRGVAPTGPGPRSDLRAVAVPTEHGGWNLTLEPVVLGLAVAWSWPGLALGVAALVAFVARTPVKAVLVDRHRRRWRRRSVVAARVAAVELAVLAVLVAFVAVSAPAATWLPLALAAPLVAVELWFDARSRSRRLVPELAGAVGMGSVATAIALAGGLEVRLAVGLWCVMAARSVAAIPFVRTQLERARGAAAPRWPSDVAQVVAVAGVIGAWAQGAVPLAGTAVIALVACVHLAALARPPRRAVVVGAQQAVIGVVVVAATAVGVTVS